MSEQTITRDADIDQLLDRLATLMEHAYAAGRAEYPYPPQRHDWRKKVAQVLTPKFAERTIDRHEADEYVRGFAAGRASVTTEKRFNEHF